ncbi:uncharacterized protein SCHCODRAFT_02508048 [Schizophyllum commune H4-8]|uniref:Uncharacterized protein n=1 Tax=Schizophyllum commune (strain H4-8 / FGSC 9210) TaxID=578458 RepID=D8Q8J1_SCHCM|nr:uncharacterized protein SCHCODRAFT_02508048 [Schizophyllum commune H4-8]KAI5890794.1 hypothetical protein SCHCODRAFT_02508048 [Schizophyllum commune H4-8]
MVASTTGTTNARSEAGRATSQSPVVEHSASGQQEGNTPDNLGSRQASDPTNDTLQAGISTPSLGDMSSALAAWEDPSIQGWGYGPPEPHQPSGSPGETSTGSAVLNNTSTSATLTITIFDETLYFDPPQPPVHLGPPHVCPICGRRYMRYVPSRSTCGDEKLRGVYAGAEHLNSIADRAVSRHT